MGRSACRNEAGVTNWTDKLQLPQIFAQHVVEHECILHITQHAACEKQLWTRAQQLFLSSIRAAGSPTCVLQAVFEPPSARYLVSERQISEMPVLAPAQERSPTKVNGRNRTMVEAV